MNTVFVVPPHCGVDRLFHKFNYAVIDDIHKADAIVFTGGADVDPSLYNEKPLPRTYANPRRDDYERQAYAIGRERNVPMIGICRGAQFLTVMQGGKLWQHVDKHANGPHKMDIFDLNGTKTGEGKTTSAHHQMMRPTKDGIILGSVQLSTQKLAETEILQDGLGVDPEIVWFPKERLYCFQGHPEWDEGETSDIFFGHIAELLN